MSSLFPPPRSSSPASPPGCRHPPSTSSSAASASHTARAVLDDARVRSLHVIEAIDAVIDWQRQGLLPLGDALTSDPRCHLDHGDFFALAAAGEGFGPDAPAPPHAVLVDIDHTPRHLLHPSHAAFYTPAGLDRLAAQLAPGGVFALWSDDPPDDTFVTSVRGSFGSCDAHVVTFPNPHTGGEASNTIYVARLDGRETTGERITEPRWVPCRRRREAGGSVRGKVALVTSACSGNGRAVAQRLVAEGASVMCGPRGRGGGLPRPGLRGDRDHESCGTPTAGERAPGRGARVVHQPPGG